MGIFGTVRSWWSKPKKHKKGKKSKVAPQPKGTSFGERLADRFTSTVGSWGFIVLQTILLVTWAAANMYFIFIQWDPYPFILLNLFLSTQAAYTGPIIMMAQKRHAKIDREVARKDYELSEESVQMLGQIAKVMKMLREDRKKEFKILKEILEEVEHDDS